MTMHRPHPITGPWPYAVRAEYHDGEPVKLSDREPTDSSLIYDDPDGALLYDGCDRCTQQAANPLHLDADKLGEAWRRMVDVERNDGHYRTRAEGELCHRLYLMALLIERSHPGVDPWQWPWIFKVTGVKMSGGFPLNQPWHLDPTEGQA